MGKREARVPRLPSGSAAGLMAVINRTLTQFYDKGRHYSLSNALSAVDTAVADGADIVDIRVPRPNRGPRYLRL
ncbi:MAG: hypothetical protein DLM60_03615 [Pseudonocardiales bacterium]|nr:MAG: hypothetical protein DLM60_03615 [Pseudonocardiales bacterium]